MSPGGDDDEFLSWSLGDEVPGDSAPQPAEPPPDESEDPLNASTRARRDLRVGARWDETYEVLGTLGRGAMGVVYRARDTKSGKEIALKILSARRLSEKARTRLRREGELTAALRHPGIVGIHSAGDVSGVPYLAYELVPDARTLEVALAELGRQEGVDLIRQAADALGHAHANAVIHRDVKPSNVLVDGRGTVRVADFGLARAEGAEALTRTGALVGTPAYMAPEQLAGEGDRVGPTTDVWALGVILYEHLTGKRPFVSANLVQLSALVWRGEVPLPRKIDPTIPRDLEAVCLKCLSRSPADRYPTGAELAQDLGNALADRPVTASSHMLIRFRVPRAWRLWAVGACALVLVVGLALLGWGWLDGRLAAGARNEALRAQLGAHQQGRGQVALLTELLETDTTSPPELLARGHLVLASSDELGWRERETHAQAALALDATRGVEANASLGAALRWQGRASEAAAAFAAAAQAGGDDELLIDQAVALLEAGQAEDALEVSARFLGSHDDEPRGLVVLGNAQLAAGRLDDAAETLRSLQRVRPGFEAEVLSALLADAQGSDSYPTLVSAVQLWPEAAAPAVALARLTLVRSGAAEVSVSVLEAAAARGATGPELDRLLRVCRALLAPEPQLGVLRSASPRLRAEATRWLWWSGRRALGIRDRALDPRFSTPTPAAAEAWRARSVVLLRAARSLEGPGDLAIEIGVDLADALGPGEQAGALLGVATERLSGARPRHLLARNHLAAARFASGLAALEGLPEDDRTAARLRGALLIALGRIEEGRRWLERGLEPGWPHELPCTEVARVCQGVPALDDLRLRLEARVERLRGGSLAEAMRLYDTTFEHKGDRDAEELSRVIQRVLDVAPRYGKARQQAARLRVVMKTEQVAGIRDLVVLADEDPPQIGDAWHALTLFSKLEAQVFRALDIAALRLEITPPADEDRVVWAFLNAAAIHSEDRLDWIEPGLRVLDELLASEPQHALAWLFRGMHQFRAGRLDLADHDLRWASQAIPGCGLVPFYQGLVQAARGAPAARVLAPLLLAREQGFTPYWHDESWEARRYPVMEPYRGVAELEFFFTGVRKGR